MKQEAFLSFLFVVLLSVGANATQLYWFTGAAVKKPTQEIANLFNKTHTDKVAVIAGGTGQVLQQMIVSKKGDIYGCMDSKFFKMAQSKGLIVKYIKFVKLTPVFGVAKESKGKIKNFYDLFKNDVKIAAGNPKTMALGKMYMYILHKLPQKLRIKMQKNVKIKAINISQIVNYIKMDSVDAGILFGAVARVNNIKYVSIPKQFNHIKTGYLAQMVFGENKTAKDKLFDFIKKHLYIYKKYGYAIIEK